ncbi:putative ATATH9 [Cinnamomum micranthum f. kanehirae]|uniref:Putative ATATH9 n=1 Tax=Cinnamomum micranthum f. kanehirae TaxID=337451 RepID=A0A3S3MR02_9MAGN|nr:putative ATATH9 [Cinnamomum micranthum f. kanehirae]
MAVWSMFRTATKLVAATTLLGGGAAIATSDNPSTAFKLCTNVPTRLVRDCFTAAVVAFDYEYSLWGLPEGSAERSKAKHEVHTRSARRLQELCFQNGGIYIKLGQHIGQLEYLVPQEYVQTMRASMLNRCPVSSYDQVCEVLLKELGSMPHEIFIEFDRVPLASASLAQVHAARTQNGEKVAVKVQHTHLTDTAAADYATVNLIVNVLHWCFPSFDYRRVPQGRCAPYTFFYLHWIIKLPSISNADGWLMKCAKVYQRQELDFLSEARNSEKCLDNFKRLSPHLADYVYAPKIHWNLSTSKLLTMEFIDAPEVTDVDAIRRLGIHPKEVAKLVSQTFAEMMFKHGFVHCDPHSANLLIRPMPSGKRNILGKRRPQLILLDHGLYKSLDFSTRTNYAALWKALVFADVNAIKENSVKLGAGEDLYALFAGILTMRPWNRVIDPAVDHLVIKGDESDRSELQMYASQYFSQISELLRRLPRVILLLLKTNDCLRAVSNSLLQGSSLDTFLIVGRVSSEAIVEMKMSQKKSVLSALCIWLEEILLEARFLGMQIALWLLELRKALAG